MSGKLSLPLIAAEEPAAAWEGFVPTVPWSALSAVDAPEPVDPQGDYAAAPPDRPLVASLAPSQRPVELLAPAGGPDAAFAAFHFGADAIYLGLKKFSARAEAENFTLAEVGELTAYAHSLEPRRRVFVTINTLIRQDELGELVEAVAGLAEIGVDALIVQDLGVYRLVRQHFPELELHASTQLSVHNGAGAAMLRRLGFQRVVLARELTFEEVHDITGSAGIETEVFIHGALCYAYSGLCLFSSQTLGRSGNRGKCAYSCRDSFEVTGAPATLRDGAPVRRDPRQGFPFSMKDLALPDHLPALRAAGVSCFKVEGRKKSPLYVATTTRYYRQLLDGTLPAEDRPAVEADLQTVFSRPWTHLFVQSHRDKEVADRDTVGHRGTPIGRVEAIAGGRLRFRTHRALERHDGLQIDLPQLGKPFGFPVDHLWQVDLSRGGGRQEVFQAPAGALVEIGLPAERPDLPLGAPVYCSSSQAVKQHYRYERPRPGLYRTRRPLELVVDLTADTLRVTGRVTGTTVESERTLPGPFPPAREPAAMEQAVRSAFEKLGDTGFTLGSLTFHNPANGFVPVSRLNQVRRELITELTQTLQARLLERRQAVCDVVLPGPAVVERGRSVRPTPGFRWSIKVDRLSHLEALQEADVAELEEIVVDIARDPPGRLAEQLAHWAGRVGKERVRLALPALTRRWEEPGLRHKIEWLLAAGWKKWEAANLSAWSYLPAADLDLATDWSIYVLNRLAAQQVLELGATRFALSPEDGRASLQALLDEFADQAVLIVHQDTPLFLAESCAYANLIGGCPGKANCRFESMELESSHGEKVTALDYHCRTIVLNRGPFCLTTRLPELARLGARNLRVDFVYRPYAADEVRDRWRQVRAGRAVPGGHAANFDRGIE